jgi:hypothetical protein
MTADRSGGFMKSFACKAIYVAVAVLTAILFALPCTIAAQVDTGAIVGAVVDNTGASVPGAMVTVTNENTGIKQTVVAGAGGGYSLSPLKLGTYTVSVASPGFKTTLRAHIDVTIQSRLEVNVQLQVGDVSQNVEVDATSPILDSQSASIQQLVEARTIVALPLNGRNSTFLAQLSPGVTFAQFDTRGLQNSGSFTANGAGRDQNNYLLDGIDNNVAIGDLANQTQYAVLPPPDALNEFTVQTSNYSAEFGHSAGAVLNMTTKSGTNKIHGDVWEFLRNDFFDAADYFVQPGTRKPEFRLNQFGGTLGGPLVIPKLYNGRDRTFFFVDFQGERRVQGVPYDVAVPTAAEQASNFQNLQDLIALQTGTSTDVLGRTFAKGTVFDPATTRQITGTVDPVTGLTATVAGRAATGQYVRDPFYTGSLIAKTTFTDPASVALLNQIPAGRINANAVNLLHLYPSPTVPNAVTTNFINNPTLFYQTNQFDTRLDEQITQHDAFFFRYSYVHVNQRNPGPFPGIADGAPSRPGNGYTESQSGALSYTHILTEHLVNEARVGYSRIFDKRLQLESNVFGIPAQYGIPGIPQIPENGGLPLFEFNQLANLGSAGTLPSDKASDVWQATENLSVDRSKSQLRMGFEFQNIFFPLATPTYSRGDFQHNGEYTSVVANTDGSTDRAQFILNPMATTVTGGISNIGGANTVNATNFPPVFNPTRRYYGGYFQDNYRAAPNLTLNLGVRYEFIGVPSERDGRIGNFVSSYTGDNADGLSHYFIPQQHIPDLSVAFVNFLATNGIVLTPTADNSIGFAQKANFAPRLGFAWQPKPKMSVRGGFGLFYQPNVDHGLSTSPYINYPFQVTDGFTAGSSVAEIVNPATGLADASIGPISQGFNNISLLPATVAPGSLTFNGEPRHPKTTYAQDYSLQMQYQVSPSTIVFAGYVGANSRHVQTAITTNTTNKIALATTALKTVSFFPNLATGGTYVPHSAENNYNSLQFGGERRFSHGFAFTANMTYSKCMGDIHDLLDNGVGSYRAPYILGIGADQTLCDIDVRKIVHTSGSYELPFGKGKAYLTSGIGRALAGGWQANWIFTGQDGQPFSVPCAITAATGLSCFALKVPSQPLYNKFQSGHAPFLNYAAFTQPAVASATNTSVSVLGGPGAQVSGPAFHKFDASLFRRFDVYRGSYLEFRWEVFNVTNSPNFGQPTQLNYSTVNTFSQIAATRDKPSDPREMQLSLKFYF